MLDLHPSVTSSSQSLADRLQRHPKLLARILALLDVVDNSSGDVVKADQAEQRVADELRQLGQQALLDWAVRKHALLQHHSDLREDLTRKEKKASTGTVGSAKSS